MCTRDALFPSFMPILGGKVGPQVGKVGPKVAPREPKGPKSSPKASPGTPKKSLKNDPGPHLEERAAREAAGVPSGGKMTPKSMEKRTCLSNIMNPGETVAPASKMRLLYCYYYTPYMDNSEKLVRINGES